MMPAKDASGSSPYREGTGPAMMSPSKRAASAGQELRSNTRILVRFIMMIFWYQPKVHFLLIAILILVFLLSHTRSMFNLLKFISFNFTVINTFLLFHEILNVQWL